MQNRPRSLYYATLAAIASTLSGLIGYSIGYFLWDLVGSYIVPHWISASLFAKMAGHFQTYESWAVFFGSLFPFPLKALSLAAGVFHIGIAPFLLFMLTARLIRFGAVATTVLLWGEKIKGFVDRHFHRIVLAVGAKIAAAFLFFWALSR
jgi:membrane protein YqaA with SNARE-associated domain